MAILHLAADEEHLRDAHQGHLVVIEFAARRLVKLAQVAIAGEGACTVLEREGVAVVAGGAVVVFKQAVARDGEAVGGALGEVHVGDVSLQRQVVEGEELFGGEGAVGAGLQGGACGPRELLGCDDLIGCRQRFGILAGPHIHTCLQSLDSIVVEMYLAVQEIAIVNGLRDLAPCLDGVANLQQRLGGCQVLENLFCHLPHGELREDAVAEGCAVGDGRLVGVHGIADAEAAQEVEVQEGTQCQRLALDDVVVVGRKDIAVVINVCQQVVGIGDAAVVGGPDTADVIGGIGGLVVVDVGILVLALAEVVPFAPEDTHEAEGELLGIGLGGDHRGIDTCQRLLETTLRLEELRVLDLRAGLHVEPGVAARHDESEK